jgi:serine/threonine protein kinase
MEFVRGKTLDAVIGRKGLPLAEALRLSIQIADALAAAHGAGIVHRDIKPSNVMVTESGLVKVLDFGLAKLSQSASNDETRTLATDERPFTEEGKIVGTAAYMSPEQAEGKTVDPRSDVFSFGALLYEMAIGRPAFQRETKLATLTAILRDEVKPLSELSDGLPPEFSNCGEVPPKRSE